MLRTPGFVVRTTASPETLAGPIRDAVRAVDPNVPVTSIATLEDAVRGATSSQRFLMWLVGTFAAVALGIAAVGVYGVMSFTVARRRQEIGIRLALGAAPGAVLRQVLGNGLRMALLGAGIGLAVAVGASRLMDSLVFGISVRDASVFAASVVVLGAVALAASVIPALRASGTSPGTTLRVEA